MRRRRTPVVQVDFHHGPNDGRCGWDTCTARGTWHLWRKQHDAGTCLTVYSCRDHLGTFTSILKGPLHRVGVCLHPQSAWADDGCVVPTVELTAETFTREQVSS